MKVSLLIKTFTLAFLIASTTMLLLGAPVGAQNPATVSVLNPMTSQNSFVFYTNASPIGTRFNLTAWVYNATDLFAYQAYLTYNSSLLSATNAWLPSWDPSWVFYGKESIKPPPNVNTVDWVQVGDSVLYGESTFNGTGLLAVIEFEITGVPPLEGKATSSLGIDNADTYLLDSALANIAVVKTNGSYEYNWVTSPRPRLEVSPTQVDFGPSPPWAVGQEIDIEIYIRSSYATWYLTNAAFSLNFNSSLLAVARISVDPFWSQSITNNVTKLGQILVSVGRTISTAHGDVLVMSVGFRVVYQGTYPRIDVSDLVLQKTQQYWLLDNFTEISVDPPLNGRVVINGLSASVPELSVFPSLVELGPQRVIGEQFDLQIWLRGLNNVWNLSRIAIRLDFNSTLIEPFAVQTGPFLTQFGNTIVDSSIEASRVNFEQTLQNNPLTYPSGEGLVATVKFNATYQKNSLGTIQAPLMINSSFLQDGDGRAIPVKVSNGIYKISSLTSAMINININPSTAEVGSDISISGFITPTKANANVTIYYRLNTSQTWTELGSLETDVNGNFAYVWKTTGANIGEYEVKVGLLGDETTYESTSGVETVSLVSKPLAFDATMWILGALLVLTILGIVSGVYLRRKRARKYTKDMPLSKEKPKG